MVQGFLKAEYPDDTAEKGVNDDFKFLSNNGAHFPRAVLIWQLRDNSDEQQLQLDVGVEVSPFPNLKQNSEGGSSALKASGDVRRKQRYQDRQIDRYLQYSAH